MSRSLLVRHPAPLPTESLLGYVLRLTEENGYDSPWRVYALAGLKQNETRTTGIKVKKLAAIAKRPVSELDEIAFAPSANHPRWAQLLGHPLVPTDLNVTKPKTVSSVRRREGVYRGALALGTYVSLPNPSARGTVHLS